MKLLELNMPKGEHGAIEMTVRRRRWWAPWRTYEATYYREPRWSLSWYTETEGRLGAMLSWALRDLFNGAIAALKAKGKL